MADSEGARPTVDVYRSAEDGHWVVHVDTAGLPDNERGPLLRVYLNDDTDDPLWANPPLSAEG